MMSVEYEDISMTRSI